MARKKAKELTLEEQLKAQKDELVKPNKIKEAIGFATAEPTYRFNVGDKVLYGAIKTSIVEEVFEDNKAYLLHCYIEKKNYGKVEMREEYRLVNWLDVRPIDTVTDTNLENKRYKFFGKLTNCTIESILNRYYFFGIDMDPEYQRGFVWDDCDREKLLDSIFNYIDIGMFAIVELGYKEHSHLYEIVDGKQRLKTIVDYYENRFAYKGKYYNELSAYDKNAFKEHQISLMTIGEDEKEFVYEYFIRLNTCGKHMDQKHLEKIKTEYIDKKRKNNQKEN